jgi:hypothetical protein
MSALPQDRRPLLDPDQMELAGRALRRMLERLRRPHAVRDEPDTSIAWEDGEPGDTDPAHPPR